LKRKIIKEKTIKGLEVKKMLYKTKQTTLPGLKTPEQEYWELINGNYSFSKGLMNELLTGKRRVKV